jgi:hypothetical protein
VKGGTDVLAETGTKTFIYFFSYGCQDDAKGLQYYMAWDVAVIFTFCNLVQNVKFDKGNDE